MRQDHYSLERDAGLYDIGRRRYAPPGTPFDEKPDFGEAAAAFGGVASMARPDRFRDAVSRMPMSTNIEYGLPASAREILRAMF